MAGTKRNRADASTSDREDAGLLARVVLKDRHAFDQLYRVYYPRLLRFLLRMLKFHHDAEEALNETMLVVWRRADSFNHSARVSTWIFGIAYRKALRQLPDSRYPHDSFDDEQSAGAEDTQEQYATRQETQARLHTAMMQLSPTQRAVVELTYYGDYSYAEIAQIMDCPTGTVKTRMLHARRKLKRLLRQSGNHANV